MDKLTVVFDSGVMFLGRLEGNKLYNPRVMTITCGDPASFDPKEKKTMVNLSPLLFFPEYIILTNYTFRYPFPEDIEKNVYELYLQMVKSRPTVESVT